MIDTIVLRVHDLRKYNDLINRLELKRNTGYKLKTVTVDAARSDKLSNIGYSDPKKRFEIMELTKTGEYLVKTQVCKQVNASHHYAFTYRLDLTRDFIEFNFSVPKYKFGSNVLMFVEHMYDKDFGNYKNSTLEHNIQQAPLLIKRFINHFLKKEFILSDINLKDVEVNRIDVCFNQVFNSKDEALSYFNYQKKLTKKHSREEDGGKTDYNTSFMYTTMRSSSKIYHKGTEYKKHDLREHRRINEEKGFQYFNIPKFQALADRILRYEVTIRSSELNYLFKHFIFRKNCPRFAIDYRNYMRISNTLKRNERISKKIGELDVKERKEFRLLHPYEMISKNDRLTYKYVSQLIERKPYFMLRISEEAEMYNEKTVNDTCNVAFFSKALISLCLKKLVAFIEEFRIKELPNEERVALLIDDYNSKHKSKLQKSDMMVFYNLLTKHGSFKEASKISGYSRATQYRYKDGLKK